MRIIIGADLVPTPPNREYFSKGNVEEFLDERLIAKLKEADVRLFNLETPLADRANPIKKSGQCLITPTICVKGIKAIGVDLLTLANNHIMDQDVQGLESTIKVLAENDIDFIGAGKNLTEAQKPYTIKKDGFKVGVYACTEHEFSIAEENSPGANPFDPFESLDHIEKLKENCDYVIVLYHGGKEYYRYPSPYLQKACRKMCDKGADLVICQHSHCVGSEEKYNGATIVYGQGNFIYDDGNDEFSENALLLDVSFDTETEVSYIPIENKVGVVKIAEDDEILKKFHERSELIKKNGYIEEKYLEFSKKMLTSYIGVWRGRPLLFKIANKLSGYRLKRKLPDKRRMAMINSLECEAHRELFIAGMKGKTVN